MEHEPDTGDWLSGPERNPGSPQSVWNEPPPEAQPPVGGHRIPAVPAPKRRRLAGVGLVAAGVVAGGVLAGALTATAATSSSSTSSGASPSTSSSAEGTQRPHGHCPAHGTAAHEALEKPVTGANATKAQAAAVKVVGSGTAGAVTTDASGTGYEVTVTKSDGSTVEVHLDSSFSVMQHGGARAGG